MPPAADGNTGATGPTVWIDADACPKPVRQIVFRAAARLGLTVRVVANTPVPVPSSPLVHLVLVPPGADVADAEIVASLAPGDLVVTADIPLANAVVKAGALAIDVRGTLYSDDNVGERCAVRDLLHDLRESGMRLDGPAPYGPRDVQRFADTFDRVVTRLIRERQER